VFSVSVPKRNGVSMPVDLYLTSRILIDNINTLCEAAITRSLMYQSL